MNMNSADSTSEPEPRPPSLVRRIFRLRNFVVAYIFLLALSHVVRQVDPYEETLRPDQFAVEVLEAEGETPTERRIAMAVTDLPGPTSDGPTILLIHGSPVASVAMVELAEALSARARVILPDLPGMGNSTQDVADLSVRAHAVALDQLLAALDISDAHVVGYSMGGGVVLELARMFPNRVRSITMLSAIGVQEFELLGDYHLNHAVHGLQLGLLKLLFEGFPHFGALDGFPLNPNYAHNFFDTDQRGLRAVLESYSGPMRILHGDNDPLVPEQAALEHYRLVPQSDLIRFKGGHITPLGAPPSVVDPIAEFVARAERDEAPTRGEADPARITEAERPFDRSRVPASSGMALIVVILLLAAATFASEDLACLSGGILVANGSLTFGAAVGGCALGILCGDIGLFLIGRVFGRRAMKLAPIRWVVSENALVRAAAWLDRRGVGVIFASRFTPGLRVPTYFAAGILPTRFFWFLFYFVLATALWTPAAVGIGALIGRPILEWAIGAKGYAGWILLAEVLLLFGVWKLAIPMFSYRGRRGLALRWVRIRRFEYWPTWIFYPPLVLYAMTHMLRRRSITIFAAANPGIEHGGFIGESKSAILKGLVGAGDTVAHWEEIPPDLDLEARVARVESFLQKHEFSWPVILKPDTGERGMGVVIVRSIAEARSYLEQYAPLCMVQEYVPGLEYGVFYIRHPDEEHGRIFAITDKRFPEVQGDGKHTLEHLILEDPQALPMANAYIAQFGERALDVPAAGERVRLIEIGTHCLGAIFLDGGAHVTPELTAEIDRISQTFEGFYFGRYDVRVPDVESFEAGREIRVIELNGVSSEATSIYDPRHGVLNAYKVLFEQWAIVYAIGALNAKRGAPVPRTWDMLRRLIWSDPRPQVRIETTLAPLAEEDSAGERPAGEGHAPLKSAEDPAAENSARK